MESVIRVTNLSKTFGKGGKALHDISLSIAPGEMVALIGPSGSGKSTLLRHLSGLSQGDREQGRIDVLGSPVQVKGKLDSDVRQTRSKIGYIFQQYNLVNRMSVMSNVLIGALGRISTWRGCLSFFTKEEQALALESLRRVGMDAFVNQRASRLSGGQQQRVAIARALTQQAELILADEPIASLDPESSRKVMEILADINERDGKTVVVTLHQVDYACKFCPRAIALKDGHIVFDGPSAMLTPARLNAIYGTTTFNDEPALPARAPLKIAGGLAIA
ncbi:phosphonate ABC transporter ATP-binding protein [Allohahella marinimesophila]|uniref:Phosphonate ABC transporter ATP-binding protein n=1 Tax=Allohahella marinimesophila TaxID=1054972 RepID=A0ABP7PMQ8_9GAMM